MFKHSFKNPLTWPTRLLLIVGLMACLVWLALSIFRRPVPAANSLVRAASTAEVSDAQKKDAPPPLQGERARVYLEQTGEGQSLMAAVTAARFGLQWQERAPFGGESGGGYLGMSHDQNLNAWFDEGGATIRPTVAEKKRAKAWQLGLRLKAYGYGEQMQAAPPVVARSVKENRIEYERSNFEFRNANLGFENASIFQSAIGNRKSEIREWYENRAEGIEQGFTINERPMRSGEVGANEPLRVSLTVTGDLHASVVDEGQKIELVDGKGKGALSYSKLMAQDADGRQLAARMEASADGQEIALVVEDAGARYPIVIDPFFAPLEQILGSDIPQLDARFGFAVAIDGVIAVVGAWREDVGLNADIGAVYVFIRSGSAWALDKRFGPSAGGGQQCGYSVAIKGNRIVYSCTGDNGGRGTVLLLQRDGPNNYRAVALSPGVNNHPGAGFGTSVAISEETSGGSIVVIGAPFNDQSGTDAGMAFRFNVDSNFVVASPADYVNFSAGDQFGTSVAVDGDLLIVGAPGVGAGRAYIFASVTSRNRVTLQPNDGATGDQFGSSVAISGNTAVVGAPSNRDRGANAGAAYVFVRDTNGNWSQQQKLLGSDAFTDGDVFGADHIAIQGNTIVVGANGWEPTTNINDNNGKAYIFMRSGTVWTQQATVIGDNNASDNFGIGVGISSDTVIAGARAATASGVARAGAAFVYRLSCVPPYKSSTFLSEDVCPGTTYTFSVITTGTVTRFQWRKNGADIQGATGSTYFIPSVSASDGASYDVFVSNSCGGEYASPATLTVRSFSIDPTSQNFSASGSNGIVSVTSTGTCNWTAVSNSPFITINSGATGTGPGPSTVGFTVAANPNSGQRTGTMTIAGLTFTVTQDGAAPLVSNVQFNASSYNVGEGDGFATITVTRTGDTSGTAAVDFATSDVGARQRTDYTLAAGTLTFASGDISKTFRVLIVDDVYIEGDETLNLTLSNPTGGAQLNSPSVATLTIIDNDSASPTTNPLDNADARFFVRQHYYDFLSRFPDQGGFDFWSGKITQCGNNPICIRDSRIDVSNQFFYELEYQQTGAYVYRLYRAAYGNTQPFPNTDLSNPTEANKLPNYSVFASDRARVIGSASLAQSQLNLANAFVQRPEFLNKYPLGLDGPAFVDAVLATIRNDIGVDLASQRSALLTLFNSGGRGAVLYRLADDNLTTNPINNRAFIDAEYNRSFVATQYFGYLRRNADIGGFLFWLGAVNSAPLHDLTRQRQMVCFFITAAEYQQRFSPVVTHTNAECPQ